MSRMHRTRASHRATAPRLKPRPRASHPAPQDLSEPCYIYVYTYIYVRMRLCVCMPTGPAGAAAAVDGCRSRHRGGRSMLEAPSWLLGAPQLTGLAACGAPLLAPLLGLAPQAPGRATHSAAQDPIGGCGAAAQDPIGGCGAAAQDPKEAAVRPRGPSRAAPAARPGRSRRFRRLLHHPGARSHVPLHTRPAAVASGGACAGGPLAANHRCGR